MIDERKIDKINDYACQQDCHERFYEWLRQEYKGMAITNTERILNFCVEYYNKHDADDEQITASDIYIMSYTDIGVGWSAFVYVKGCIYELSTVDVSIYKVQ